MNDNELCKLIIARSRPVNHFQTGCFKQLKFLKKAAAKRPLLPNVPFWYFCLVMLMGLKFGQNIETNAFNKLLA